jgi:large subunit ribosomal protein L36e
MAKTHPSVIAIGKNKGHPITKFKVSDKAAKKIRPANRKGALEKRVIEFLKAGSLKDTKRALKLSKKALGTHRRAKLKRENLMNLLRAQQSKAKK